MKNLLLKEEKCPYCGTPDAYVGVTRVECKNPKCSFYVPPPYGGEKLVARLEYGGHGDVGAKLSDGRYIDIDDIIETLAPYDDYGDDDDEYMAFQIAAGQKILRIAGVTHVVDTESNSEEEVPFDEYEWEGDPLTSRKLKKILKNCDAEVAELLPKKIIS